MPRQRTAAVQLDAFEAPVSPSKPLEPRRCHPSEGAAGRPQAPPQARQGAFTRPVLAEASAGVTATSAPVSASKPPATLRTMDDTSAASAGVRRALAWGEAAIRGLDPRHLRGLPRPTTVHAELDGRPLVITSSRRAYRDARARGEPAFAPRELVAMAVGARSERFGRRELAALLGRKRAAGGLVLTPELALDGLAPAKAAALDGWTIGDTLDALGVEVRRVEVHA